MKYLTIALLLLSTAAYAEDSKPEAAAGATTTTPVPSGAPAVTANPTPVQPSVWMVENLDKRDLTDIQNGLGKCPKDVADPLIALFNSKIKVQK